MPFPKMLNYVEQIPTIPSPPFGGAEVSAWGQAQGATVVIYTVAASKVLAITDWNIVYNHGGLASTMWATVNSPGPVITKCFSLSTAINFTLSVGYPLTTPVMVPAGYTISIYSSIASSICSMAFGGWLLDKP